MDLERYREFFDDARNSAEYWADVAVSEFTRDLLARMRQKSVSRAELARRMGTSRAYITKLLGGNANFTIATMVRLAMALDGALHVHLSDARATTRWVDEMPTGRSVEADAMTTV